MNKDKITIKDLKKYIPTIMRALAWIWLTIGAIIGVSVTILFFWAIYTSHILVGVIVTFIIVTLILLIYFEVSEESLW